MRELFKNEISGWKKTELLWLVFVCAAITALSAYWGDSLVGIISAVTGVLYVMLTGKGKLSAYIFGTVNCVLYSMISYKAQLFGETILNVFYYIPMMFVGFFLWKKNMNEETKEVKKERVSFKGRVILASAILLGTAAFGKGLDMMGDALPYVDSFTTVSSVVAMIVAVRRYAEQWWIWLFVNLFSIYMWWQNFSAGQENFATLLMWVVYLVNGIFILIKWERELKKG
ncbi:MAG: nicotinamide mononucleotide transporter [Clostridia bacterium]|nr:nicotinamide mononucleotide transporter [Clostridia bacterium]